jgi:copper transport protein
MRRLVLPVALVAALAAPAAAFAHASISSSSPASKQRLQQSPREVSIRFDQTVKAFPNAIRVYTATGRLVSGSPVQRDHGRVVAVPVERLPRGPYTVRWQVLSGDGHVVSGVRTFGVRFPAPEPTAAYGASGPTTGEHIVRWLYFISLALVVGGLGFRLLVLPRVVPPGVQRRFYWIVGVGVLATLEIGIVAFLLRAEDALQLPFGRFIYGDLSPIANGTRFGSAFIAMTLGFALVAALVFLAWLTERRALLWAAFAIAAGFASGLSLSGHSAVDPGDSKWSELADWVHLCAASLWAGGLVQLVVSVWPSRELRRDAFLRFSRLAPVLVALLLGAGIYLSVLRLPHFHDLWTAGYGRVLLVKIGLVSLALAWGGFHHAIVRPRLDRLSWVSRSLAGEGAVAMAVLLVAAVLVDSKPPARPVPQPAQAAAARR